MSPAHGQAYADKEWEADPTREMYKAAHLLTLEPEEHARIVIKDGRWAGALKEEVETLQGQGYLVLKQKDFDTARAMSASIKSCPRAADALKKSIPEVSLFWMEETPEGLVYCKARLDALTLDDSGIFLHDMKAFTDLSDEELLGIQVMKRGYHMQFGWYSRGIFKVFGEGPLKCSWAWVEDEKPYGVKLRSCPPSIIDQGWAPFPDLLKRYAKCERDNIWPLYDDEETDITMPKFYLSAQKEAQ